MGFAPTWLRQVSPLTMTTLTTAFVSGSTFRCRGKIIRSMIRVIFMFNSGDGTSLLDCPGFRFVGHYDQG